MNSRRIHKKNLIVSYKNLSDELKLTFKELYPEGYEDYLQRFDKPNGDTIFVVPMETEDTVYMVKFDVKIDTTLTDEDIEKDFFDEEVDKADQEFAPLQEAIDKEESGSSHTERSIRHGDYEEGMPKRKSKKSGELNDLGKELSDAFDDDFDNFDDDADEDLDEEGQDLDNEFEPSDEDLNDIDSDFYLANAEIPPEELARMEAQAAPAPKKKGRPRKNPLPVEPAVPKKKGRPRKEVSAVPVVPKKKGRPRKNPEE
ncbi:MAG: hypothetical protein MJZ67_02755 [Bacteroidales bacterium]|nr:hypothetical protein [Bacteroidales bacterium]